MTSPNDLHYYHVFIVIRLKCQVINLPSPFNHLEWARSGPNDFQVMPRSPMSLTLTPVSEEPWQSALSGPGSLCASSQQEICGGNVGAWSELNHEIDY